MKIFGIGTDIVNIKRIEKSIRQYGQKFKNRVFSENEIAYCEKKRNSGSFYAKRFAAKEAFAKAMGGVFAKDVSLKNIEIFNDSRGKPYIKLKSPLDTYLKKKIRNKKYDIYLSLTDDKPWAQATVIISHN